MPFTTVMTDTAAVDDSIIKEYDQNFIVAAAEQGVMNQFVSYRQVIGAESIKLPKYANLPLSTTPLDEDEDVVSAALSDSEILFTPKEYGNAVTTTRLAELQTGGTAGRASARLVGEAMGRSTDKLAILAAEASSNEIFPGAVASEGALTASDVMTPTFLNKLYNKLSRSNITPMMNGLYVAVMHDDVIHDLRNETGSGSWQDINKYARPEDVLRNAVGVLSGFMIVRDNNISINADAGDTNVDTYHTLAMGFNALGRVESQPGRMTVTGPFDKLGRFVNVGWHWVGEYGIVDTDALFVGTTASSIGANS